MLLTLTCRICQDVAEIEERRYRFAMEVAHRRGWQRAHIRNVSVCPRCVSIGHRIERGRLVSPGQEAEP